MRKRRLATASVSSAVLVLPAIVVACVYFAGPIGLLSLLPVMILWAAATKKVRAARAFVCPACGKPFRPFKRFRFELGITCAHCGIRVGTPKGGP